MVSTTKYYVHCQKMLMIGVTYTPEAFPTKDWGTGDGPAMTANKLGGILAPAIAMHADSDTLVPVYIAGSMRIMAGAVVWLLPYRSHRKTSL
jgi:hypothetical protein